MGTSNTFWWLSQALERYESGRAEIQRVEATRPDDPRSNGELRATVDIAVPLCATLTGDSADDLSPTAATIREDGGLRVDFPPSSLPTANRIENERVSVEEADSVRVEGGTILVTSIVTVDPDGGTERPADAEEKNAVRQPRENASEAAGDAESSAETVEESADEQNGETSPKSARSPAVGNEPNREDEFDAVRSEGLPPFEDTDYLRRIYEACDTFIEMADVIEMDVSAETVRRYMTEAGVHEPATYNTVSSSDGDSAPSPERDESAAATARGEDGTEGSNGDSESATVDRRSDEPAEGWDSDDPVEDVENQPLIADGIGLPDGVTLDRLADAVESSITIHEVTRELDIGRDEARQLLERLNLLDLVLTRVWKEDSSEVSRNEIADRIRQSVTSGS
ncbi:hypothetical protein [Haladaptatus salinisoli]|uniref:hypothetical protein n=1 Tax=Haladaptatus salinisoli TaxID=2884876 RepID=UPI001D0B7453|nr:hypothetical protein [Haladaptatus salinisoli]